VPLSLALLSALWSYVRSKDNSGNIDQGARLPRLPFLPNPGKKGRTLGNSEGLAPHVGPTISWIIMQDACTSVRMRNLVSRVWWQSGGLLRVAMEVCNTHAARLGKVNENG
jgi:hypothetical protein